MSATTRRRRWNDTAIDNELRTQTKELGHFPTRAELLERGLRGLWDAMRNSGGVDHWRERIESRAAAVDQDAAPGGQDTAPGGQDAAPGGQDAAPARAEAAAVATVDAGAEPAAGPAEIGASSPASGEPPSHDAIARRAYELYESGVPGDAVSHWLAAEQQLRA